MPPAAASTATRVIQRSTEDYSPFQPISTYGASKLACEALICAYCHMFEMEGVAFRFANVVGPRQTHGVAYDFIRRLLRDPGRLEILGDGTQSKSYIHVNDVLDALLLLNDRAWTVFGVFNVATEDYVTVRQIADLVAERLGTSRAWSTSLPVEPGAGRGMSRSSASTRPSSAGLAGRTRGTSVEALRDSIDSMIADARAGMFEAPAS